MHEIAFNKERKQGKSRLGLLAALSGVPDAEFVKKK